jgi:hypothetical protein
MELKLVLVEGGLQPGDKLAAKDATERLDREEERVAGWDPAQMVGSQAPAAAAQWTVLLLPFRFSSCSLLLHAGCFCLNSDCPDETHQFASNRSHDLSLVLACCHQFHISLVQAILS